MTTARKVLNLVSSSSSYRRRKNTSIGFGGATTSMPHGFFAVAVAMALLIDEQWLWLSYQIWASVSGSDSGSGSGSGYDVLLIDDAEYVYEED